MTQELDFDLQVAHQHFSTACFNAAWELMEKPDRTPDEDQEMVRLSLASTWHWTQREDCTPTNLSVGYWQTSRIYALLGQAENAKRYGQLCLEASRGEDTPPFYRGYAYEALARAESVAGRREKVAKYLEKAHRIANAIPKPDVKQMLLDDLDTVEQ